MVQQEGMTASHKGRQNYLRVQTGIWLVWLQEIMQALVIDLHIAHAYPAVLPIIWGSQLGSLGKQVLQSSRNQTSCIFISTFMTYWAFRF